MTLFTAQRTFRSEPQNLLEHIGSPSGIVEAIVVDPHGAAGHHRLHAQSWHGRHRLARLHHGGAAKGTFLVRPCNTP